MESQHLRAAGCEVTVSLMPSVLLSSSVALMNHSCSPNVIVTYKGTVAEVRAVKDINPGEEVSNDRITLMQMLIQDFL